MSQNDQVAEAEKKKAEAHAEHQRKALICNKAELEVCLVAELLMTFKYIEFSSITLVSVNYRKEECFFLYPYSILFLNKFHQHILHL